MSPDRRCTALLAGAMVLCLAVPLAAQDTLLFPDEQPQDDPVSLEFVPLVFQQSVLDTRLSAGIMLDYVLDARAQVNSKRFRGTPIFGEETYQDGVRFNGFLEYQLVPSAYWFVQAGLREEELEADLKEDSEVTVGPSALTLGDLQQYSFMTGFKFTSTVPFIGTGRTWSEISLWPTGSVAIGAHLYNFDKDSGAFGQGQDMEFETSFAGEARIGLDLRIPPILVVGINVGYYWSSPEFRLKDDNTSFSEHDHLNVSAYIVGVHGALRF